MSASIIKDKDSVFNRQSIRSIGMRFPLKHVAAASEEALLRSYRQLESTLSYILIKKTGYKKPRLKRFRNEVRKLKYDTDRV